MADSIKMGTSVTGVQHSVHTEGGGMFFQEFTPTSVQNAILDDCKTLAKLDQRTGSGFRHAAKIPIQTHAWWKREWREKYRDKWTWQTFLAMKLNSSEYKNLRTGVIKL